MSTSSEWLFQNHDVDTSHDVDDIEGTVPAELRGTFLRCGSGLVQVGDVGLNLFEAHGHVGGLAFGGGKPRFRARSVKTAAYADELAAGKVVWRRPFTNKPGRWSNLFDVKFASTAMHNAYGWGGKVVAGDAPGHYLLDPATLETLGPVPVPMKSGDGAAPLPRFDPATNRLVFYVQTQSFRDKITFYELDSDWRVAASRGPVSLPKGGLMLHDLALSEHFYVLTHWGTLSVPGALWGARPAGDFIGFNPSTDGALILVPRRGDGPPRYLPTPGHEMFHLFNAYEEGDTLIADTTGYDGRVDFRTAYPPKERAARPSTPVVRARVVRWRIGLSDNSVQSEVLGDTPMEGPDVHHAYHGKKHRFGYASAKTVSGDEADPDSFWWFHGLGKIDFQQKTTQTWNAGPDRFVSVPSFAPRAGSTEEDDGWLLSYLAVPKDKRTEVVILDARDLTKGPVATLRLKDELGMVSHTSFEPHLT